jgi:uncharacterized protein
VRSCATPLPLQVENADIKRMPDLSATRKCPICGKPAAEQFRPFCSKRCADVDLHRWFSGRYAIPVAEQEKEESAQPAAEEGEEG